MATREFVQSKDGLKIRYEIRGSGEPLALIMGFSGSGRAWGEAFLSGIEKRFQTVVIDNRGTGESDQPDQPWTLTDMANDVAAVLDHAKIPRAHVYGISMGGMIAQEFALNYAARVRGLVLGCTNCGMTHSVAANPENIAKLMPQPGKSAESGAARIFGGMRQRVSEFERGQKTSIGRLRTWRNIRSPRCIRICGRSRRFGGSIPTRAWARSKRRRW